MIKEIHRWVIEYFDFLEHEHWMMAGDFVQVVVMWCFSVLKWVFILLITYQVLLNISPDITQLMIDDGFCNKPVFKND